jgi:hypothetical protein
LLFNASQKSLPSCVIEIPTPNSREETYLKSNVSIKRPCLNKSLGVGVSIH